MKDEITQESFADFLEWLSPDAARAGEEYELLRWRLFRYFASRHCNFAEELVDETINRVTVKCTSQQIDNKLAYCYGVAKNVYRESLRKERVQVDIDDVEIAAPAPVQSFSSECLDKCLQKLSPKIRDLLLDYFLQQKKEKIDLRKSMSEKLNMTPTALRMCVMRSKRDLKRCVEDCMS